MAFNIECIAYCNLLHCVECNLECSVLCNVDCSVSVECIAIEGCVEPEEVIVVNLFGDQGHFWWVQQELLAAQLETDKIKIQGQSRMARQV